MDTISLHTCRELLIKTNKFKKGLLIMETSNELTLTLIQNSCKHLYDWADKAENKKIWKTN